MDKRCKLWVAVGVSMVVIIGIWWVQLNMNLEKIEAEKTPSGFSEELGSMKEEFKDIFSE